MKSLGTSLVRNASPETQSLRMGNDCPLPFDVPSAQNFAEARADFLDRVLAFWPGPALATAFDAGTGVGFFAGHLARRHGLQVMASDARASNVEEARRRHPNVGFFAGDVEDPALVKRGEFDVVAALGLLYHLENPFRAVRNLAAITRHLLIIESLLAPARTAQAWFLDEFAGKDQAPNYVAWHLTEAAIVKLLYRAGIPHVYRARFRPSHVQFRGTFFRRRTRGFVLGSRVQLDPARFERLAERFYRLDRSYYLRWPARLVLQPLLEWRYRRFAGAVNGDRSEKA